MGLSFIGVKISPQFVSRNDKVYLP